MSRKPQPDTELFNPWPEILEEARRLLRLSQEKAAEQAGVGTATWYRWESGDVYPGPHQLANMARALDLSPDELALRYAETLARHYRCRLAAGGELHPDPATAHLPPHPAAAPPHLVREGDPRALGFRAISREGQAVLATFYGLFDRLTGGRPPLFRDERPVRPRSRRPAGSRRSRYRRRR